MKCKTTQCKREGQDWLGGYCPVCDDLMNEARLELALERKEMEAE